MLIRSEDPSYKPPYQIWMKSDQWLKRQCVATTWPIKKESWCNFQTKVGQVWPYAYQVWRPLVQTCIPNLNEIRPIVYKIMHRNHLTYYKTVMTQFSAKIRSIATLFQTGLKTLNTNQQTKFEWNPTKGSRDYVWKPLDLLKTNHDPVFSQK